MSEFVCPKCGATLTVCPVGQYTAQKPLSVDDVRVLFPADLEQLLTFTQAEHSIIVKPKRFLATENFAKIAHIVRANKGEYISAGKESHFRIPTKTE